LTYIRSKQQQSTRRRNCPRNYTDGQLARTHEPSRTYEGTEVVTVQ